MTSLRDSFNNLFTFFAAMLVSFCASAPSAYALPPVSGAGLPLKVALLPLENLSGGAAPLKDLKALIAKELAKRGAELLEERTLDQFMERHRIRYTGGLDAATSEALKEETGVDSILITSVELYDEGDPPRIALIERLVSSGRSPRILWMDSAAMTGADSPGFLGLGLISDPAVLAEKTVGTLGVSFKAYLTGEERRVPRTKRTFNPRTSYLAPALEQNKQYAVAVVPFFNESTSRNAGDIVMLHLVKELVRSGRFSVLEPGLVRQQMLNVRVIMDEGISLNQADMLSNYFDADLVINGKVEDYFDYQGPAGTPRVDFSVLAIDKNSRKVVWTSRSRNDGNDRVIFFDCGNVTTGDGLVSEMARSLVVKMLHDKR